ncbi:guanitoxin biosynthesis heme-dependent pre-guanitoxin N-hydroxylase GntA [Christiangramia echinicola]|uniref:guanitoxin biosynthesis heme-dependent pre-guanitoxin N-hydroxylase GntA n=1 Tax=Christiangramia echinicola TaxID=279359 RepID=UPI0004218878|nr:guanitoxin biosynthesis heme-dependent pre-guanitoxin N-hydroxylase GntA [Christiangramia echinicola]
MKMEIEKRFKNWILQEDHPCIMAQTVFSQKAFRINNYGELGNVNNVRKLLKDINHYIENYDFTSNDFQTLIAVFPDSEITCEDEFELLLWKQLSDLARADNKTWDAEVSNDPENENFSFSLGGRAFYIVGMHPESSRIARKSPYPSIAFNLHHQFEKLREMGVYHNVRDKIRERDKNLQGSINPVLQDFGERSEARQYSGKATEEEWTCPFHR